MTSNSIPKTIQTYRAHFRATPQAIWDALTRRLSSTNYASEGSFGLTPTRA